MIASRGMSIDHIDRERFRTNRVVAPLVKKSQSVDVINKSKNLKMRVTKCNYRGHNYCEATANGNTYLLKYGENGSWNVQNQI